jgi:hypothetical protein
MIMGMLEKGSRLPQHTLPVHIWQAQIKDDNVGGRACEALQCLTATHLIRRLIAACSERWSENPMDFLLIIDDENARSAHLVPP